MDSGTAASAGQPLFRLEAVDARRTQWLGSVILARSLSQSFYALFAFIAACAILAFVIFGQFTRKATVKGWLIPEQGLVKVFAPQGGVINQVRIREGAAVKRGDVLMVISAESQSAAGGTQAEIGRLLEGRRASLESERRQMAQLFGQQKGALTSRLAALRAEGDQVALEMDAQKERTDLASVALERQRDLQKKGFIPLQQVQQQEELLLEQRVKLRAVERSRLEVQREIGTVLAQLNEAPLNSRRQDEALQREVSAIDQARVETEARREIIISAPHDGVVTAILGEAGGTASPNMPLLSIVPRGARLKAQLFSPSRAIGFVQPGQQVLVRYEAYPYQKFGRYEGTVETVSQSAITPGELPVQLAGLPALYGSNEPMYRIVVQLKQQKITAYGKQQALTPGMLLEADVITDRRRLYEWILDPLYTLTGRL